MEDVAVRVLDPDELLAAGMMHVASMASSFAQLRCRGL
jgi:hypothetical protein